ncbi:hypothetical protein J2R98_001704 [Alkalibacillus filiformis]|uniref:DUF2007 domain-containing protein n=1 Tax=Alkalibacillus filiformis TaxID=200990 RepID=A0ABU0DTT3_9BACI|nr:hypothetical protein [Alkalibacillus filiformis]MDQ0351872.1 hypothetical protein [Alkalibacillus filiformis]
MINPLIVLIALSLTVIVIRLRVSRKYDTLYEAVGNRPNEINNRYQFLHNQGVRCRLQNVSSRPGVIIHGSSELGTTVRLLVHKNDLNEAEQHMIDYKRSC